jgi:UDP-glucose 4-epimerase
VSVVLITGVSRFLGGRLAAQLAADPGIERVIGVDAVAPRPADVAPLGRTEFVRADIRTPMIGKVLARARVTTVVHAALMASPRPVGGRLPMQEMNVIGTMQLLGACQKSDTVERFVLRSTTAIYGASPADPAVFAEDTEDAGDHAENRSEIGADNRSGTRGPHATGHAKDAVEVEGYVRGFARRRPDVEVSVLRMANVLGPTIDNALARYLRMPVVPTALGFDPRLQLLHEDDAVEVLRLATVSSRPGTFNVAGDGVVTLAQLLRRIGRLRLPVPAPVLPAVAAFVRNGGAGEVSAEQLRYLLFGRVVDTGRLRTTFGYRPQHDTASVVRAFAAGLSPRRRPALALADVGSRVLTAGARNAGARTGGARTDGA